MFPYRGEQGGGASEDRVSSRPDLNHLSFDFDWRSLPHRRDGAAYRGVGIPCQQPAPLNRAWAADHGEGAQKKEGADMQVIGLCRFSYPGEGGFQVTHDSLRARMAHLYAPARMEERFATFETKIKGPS